MNQVDEVIPNELMHILANLRPTLEVRGAVQPHRRIYRLRYKEADKETGSIICRSLALGPNPQVAEAVKDLIAKWREEISAREAEARRIAAENRTATQAKLAEQRLIIAMDGGGSRRRKQLRKWFKSLETDPVAALRFALTRELPPRGKRGPRRKPLLGHPSPTHEPKWLKIVRERIQSRNQKAAIESGLL